MAEKVELSATKRNEYGKGFARRLRAKNLIPSSIYSKGGKPTTVSIDEHSLLLALKKSNALYEIDIEGNKVLAIAKDIQIDPLSRRYYQVDFLEVKAGEKVKVEIPVKFIGEPAPHTLVLTETSQIEALADPLSLPEFVELSIEGQETGTSLHVSDLQLPEGIELLTHGDINLATFQEEKEEKIIPVQAEGEEGEAAEGEEPAAAEDESSEEKPAE